MRLEAGLNQTAVARALDVDQKTISALENGAQRAFVDQILDIEKACGQPAGTALRRAGLIAETVTTTDAIEHDPRLDAAARSAVLGVYRTFSSSDGDGTAAKRTRAASRKRRS